jgi:hypothetical protein
MSSCKITVFPVRFYLNLNFLDRLWKMFKISNLTKMRPMGAEFFHLDRQTDKQTLRGQ